ncbi:hypothetical protein QJS04_geneDACA020618 [Acorus gramineus]|uniref:AT-hook motif nuclear-localized protein n=1 Tax=Acorus gramineus TaxID=55184 RepID=A0AAV9B6H6_ACOGR|nr:hypothetical protein QJS04_geneDACA020618 [Acorus gramineus]
MEGRDVMSSGSSAATAEPSGNYAPPPPPPEAAAKSENPSQGGAVVSPPPPQPPPPPAVSGPLVVTPPSSGAASTGKKRGRPRKYGPDGRPVMPLNPMPISASMPSGEFSGVVTPSPATWAAMKRGRGRPLGSVNKQHQRVADESLGELVSCSAGANFTPHIITVAAGEDVTMKIISFSQQGPQAICILSANGAISNVTLRQPDSSGGTLTYEGRFEILSLSGSFMPTESGGTRSRSGGMSVSLASPDGRVVGGGVAGLLVAASPVQVVVGSFMTSHQQDLKIKKPKYDSTSVSMPAGVIPISTADAVNAHGVHRNSSTPKPTLASSSSFRGDSWSSMHSMPESGNLTTDINISLPSG